MNHTIQSLKGGNKIINIDGKIAIEVEKQKDKYLGKFKEKYSIEKIENRKINFDPCMVSDMDSMETRILSSAGTLMSQIKRSNYRFTDCDRVPVLEALGILKALNTSDGIDLDEKTKKILTRQKIICCNLLFYI